MSVAKTMLLTLAFVFLTSPAFACSPVVDDRSLNQRAEDASLVFIGRVEAVTPQKVSFVTPKGAHVQITPINNTCGISFSVGEVWLYIGPEGYSGSKRLTEADFKADLESVLIEPTR